jgi:hypothetical protein
MAILEEAIRACRARRRDIRCFHYVSATPTGVHTEAEEAIILQSVNDIAAGSDEKLVLLDLEIHFHPLPSGLLVPAAASRKVIKVNPTLHRDQLLLLTGLFEYCKLQQDRCTIFKNNELWTANDVRTHPMTHGMYLRIQVPPPQDPTLDTEIAIAIARDLAEEEDPARTEVAARCRQTNNALSLRQIGASPQVDTTEWEPPVQQIDQGPLQVRAQIPLQADQRQRGRFADVHAWRLTRLRDRNGLIECEEEGRVMYVTVYGSYTTSNWLDVMMEDRHAFQKMIRPGLRSLQTPGERPSTLNMTSLSISSSQHRPAADSNAYRPTSSLSSQRGLAIPPVSSAHWMNEGVSTCGYTEPSQRQHCKALLEFYA